jgi:hypothetical protein
MTVNNYSTGEDITLNFTDQNGQNINIVPAGQIINFDAKPITETKRIDPLNGYSVPLIFYVGWEGTFEMERQNNLLDVYWATLEAAYYNGLNQTGATINQTIREPDGSTTQFQYINVIPRLEDAGMWKRTDSVTQKLSFMCSARLIIQ